MWIHQYHFARNSSEGRKPPVKGTVGMEANTLNTRFDEKCHEETFSYPKCTSIESLARKPVLIRLCKDKYMHEILYRRVEPFNPERHIRRLHTSLHRSAHLYRISCIYLYRPSALEVEKPLKRIKHKGGGAIRRNLAKCYFRDNSKQFSSPKTPRLTFVLFFSFPCEFAETTRNEIEKLPPTETKINRGH